MIDVVSASRLIVVVRGKENHIAIIPKCQGGRNFFEKAQFEDSS
jgi:hypothetical protein